MIDGDPVDFWALFSVAVVRLKIDKTLSHQVLYVLRHSGASADAWSKHQAFAASQIRGRWKSANGARRYAKGGRVAHQLSLCSVPRS